MNALKILHNVKCLRTSAEKADAMDFEGYYGAQNDYTHIFIVWELIPKLHRTSVTQGFLAGIIFL